mmetsp:Transcript_79172/g.220101  ORF Transcript_79172/g.220101 Transcript_79172/m.220101 type:complete len:216 (+) Transcript_79172:219-866(+)
MPHAGLWRMLERCGATPVWLLAALAPMPGASVPSTRRGFAGGVAMARGSGPCNETRFAALLGIIAVAAEKPVGAGACNARRSATVLGTAAASCFGAPPPERCPPGSPPAMAAMRPRANAFAPPQYEDPATARGAMNGAANGGGAGPIAGSSAQTGHTMRPSRLRRTCEAQVGQSQCQQTSNPLMGKSPESRQKLHLASNRPGSEHRCDLPLYRIS